MIMKSPESSQEGAFWNGPNEQPRPTVSTGTQTAPSSGGLADFASSTTLHGIGHVMNAETSIFRRSLWLLSFLCFLSWFTFYFSQRIIYFSSSPTTTRVTVQSKRVMDFPAVTICNYNLMKKTIVESNPDYLSYARYMTNFTLSPFAPPNISTLTPGALAMNLTKFTELVTHQLNESIVYCQFQAMVGCLEYFEYTMTKNGRCFTFNSYETIKNHGNIFKTTRPGLDYGLMLRLNTQQEEYVTGISMAAGFKVFVHHPDTFPSVEKHGFAVGPGTETLVAISEIRTAQTKALFGSESCFNTEIKTFKNPLEFYEKYSVEACKMECLTKLIMQNCSCVPYYLKGSGMKECLAYDTHNCVLEVEIEYFINDKYEKSCDCKRSCDETFYEPSLSAATFPSENIARYIEDTYEISREYIKENFLDIRIYFEEMSYQSIEQIPSYNGSDFQADVGGQLGLCLGASLMTLIEFLEFIYTLLKSVCSKLMK